MDLEGGLRMSRRRALSLPDVCIRNTDDTQKAGISNLQMARNQKINKLYDDTPKPNRSLVKTAGFPTLQGLLFLRQLKKFCDLLPERIMN